MPNIAIIMEQKQKKTYKKEQKSMGIGWWRVGKMQK